MKRSSWITVAVIVFAVVLLYVFLFSVIASSPKGKGGSGGSAVGVVHLSGVISADGEGSALNVSSTAPEIIIDRLKEADEDDSIKAVVLRVNSPGGSAAASQEIYEAVRRFKKPIVVSVGDICASGAYYIASASDEIMASPASAVGSIGVIMEIPNLQELYKKLGVKFSIITKGRYKDLGNPARGLKPAEKKILDDQAQVVYEQFINDVAKARRMPVSKVKEIATGLDFPGSEAIGMNLIDTLGNYQDALDAAAVRGGIPKGKDYEIVVLDESDPFSFLTSLLESRSALATLQPLADKLTRSYKY